MKYFIFILRVIWLRFNLPIYLFKNLFFFKGSVERSCAGELNGNTNEANTDTSKKPKIETFGGVSETNITDEPAAKKPKLETSGGVSETNNESGDKQSSAEQQPEAETKPVKYGLK